MPVSTIASTTWRVYMNRYNGYANVRLSDIQLLDAAGNALTGATVTGFGLAGGSAPASAINDGNVAQRVEFDIGESAVYAQFVFGAAVVVNGIKVATSNDTDGTALSMAPINMQIDYVSGSSHTNLFLVRGGKWNAPSQYQSFMFTDGDGGDDGQGAGGGVVGPGTGGEDNRVPPTSTKWRVFLPMNKNNGNANTGFSDAEFHLEPGGSQAMTDNTKLSVNRTAFGAKNNLIDGVITSGNFWVAEKTFDNWFEYDFTSAVTVKEVRFYEANDGTTTSGPQCFPTEFGIQYWDAVALVWVTYWYVTGQVKSTDQRGVPFTYTNPDPNNPGTYPPASPFPTDFSFNYAIGNPPVALNVNFDYAITTSAPRPASTKWRVNLLVNNGVVSNNMGFVELQMFEATGSNLMTDGTKVAVSRTDFGAAANVVDGNTSTYWVASGGACWLSYDFGVTARTIVDVKMQALAPLSTYATQYPKDWNVEYWDGAAWQIAWTVRGSADVTGSPLQDYPAPPPSSGPIYNNFYFNYQSFGKVTRDFGFDYYYIEPIEIDYTFDYVIAAVNYIDPSYAGSAISSGGSDPSLAFDRNTATLWESQAGTLSTGDVWLGFHFDTAYDIKAVQFMLNTDYHEDEQPVTAKIRWSDDGVTWTDSFTPVIEAWAGVFSIGTQVWKNPDQSNKTPHAYWQIQVLSATGNLTTTHCTELYFLVTGAGAIDRTFYFDYGTGTVGLAADFTFNYKIIREIVGIAADFDFDYKIIQFHIDYTFDYQVYVQAFGATFVFDYIILADFPDAPVFRMPPETPITETLVFSSNVITSYAGNEQRSSVRENPSQSVALDFVILDDADRAIFMTDFMRMMKGVALVPQWQYAVTIDAIAIGESAVAFNQVRTDIRGGDYVYFVTPQGLTGFLAGVANMTATGCLLASPMVMALPKGSWIMPVRSMHLTDGDGISMNSIDGAASINADGLAFRPATRYGQQPGLLTEYDGLVVLDKRPLVPADETYTGNDSLLTLTQGVPAEVFQTWSMVVMAGKRSYIGQRGAGLDYWREFAALVAGQRVPFLLPTFRKDLQPKARSAGVLTVAGQSYLPLAGFAAYSRLAIETELGLQFVTIVDAQPNGDDTDLTLTQSVVGTTIKCVSYLNQVRLSSDQITFTHDVLTVKVDISIRATNE